MQASRTLCFGLVRAGGAFGFALGAALVFGIGRQVLHLDFAGNTIWELSRRETVLAVLALIVGMLGLGLGQGLGASIRIREDGWARNIDSIWHFGANSVIIWNGISLLVFGLAMGKQAARSFRTTHKMSEMIWLGMVLPLLVGWSIAFLLWFSVVVLPRFSGAGTVKMVVYVSPVAAAFAFGAYEASKLGLNSRWGLAMAVAPLLLIPVSLDCIRKDAQRRAAS